MLAHGPDCERLARGARGALDVLGARLRDGRDLTPLAGSSVTNVRAVRGVEALGADQQLLAAGEELTRGGAERVGQGGGCVGGGGHGGSLFARLYGCARWRAATVAGRS